jgi:hypothetical protein
MKSVEEMIKGNGQGAKKNSSYKLISQKKPFFFFSLFFFFFLFTLIIFFSLRVEGVGGAMAPTGND